MLNRSNVYNKKLYKVLLYKKLVLVIYDVLLHINIFKYCGLSTVINLHLHRFFFILKQKVKVRPVLYIINCIQLNREV